MKIKCQEHYDKVVEYATALATQLLRNVSNASNSGRQIPTESMKLNCIGISHRIHSVLLRWLRTEAGVLSVDCYTMANRMNLLP